jgi:hypothetical protein
LVPAAQEVKTMKTTYHILILQDAAGTWIAQATKFLGEKVRWAKQVSFPHSTPITEKDFGDLTVLARGACEGQIPLPGYVWNKADVGIIW